MVIVFYELQVNCVKIQAVAHTLNTFEEKNVNLEVGVFFFYFCENGR